MLGIGRYTYLLCIQYFACLILIFVGNGCRRKISRSTVYGTSLVCSYIIHVHDDKESALVTELHELF